MTVRLATNELPRVTIVVRQLETRLLSYLWACAESARYIPSISSTFLLRLHQQTILGWWWLIIRALLPSLGLIAILQHVPSLKPASVPYGLYVISGMMLWTVMSNVMNRGTRSIKQSRSIQSRLAIPNLIFLICSGSVAAFYFAVFATVFCLIVIYYYISADVILVRFGWQLLLAPLPLLICFLLSTGIASFTSVIFLFARDARLMLGVLMQSWFYFTPVIYGIDILPTGWRWAILYLNPVTPLLELFRWSLFGIGAWTITSFACSMVISILVFLTGAWFMMRSEWVVREVMR